MSDNNLFQINIPKRSSTCCKGGESINPGMEYYSILLNDEDAGYVRKDYCVSCFDSIEKAKTAWKAKASLKQDEEKQEALKSRDEKVLYLLKNVLHVQDKELEAEKFVLALYLARRKIIVLRQEIKEKEGIYCIYEVVDTEEMITIQKHPLLDVDLGLIQKSISNKLQAIK